VILTLPKPPSVNALFATDWKTKRRFKSKVYEHWLAEAEAVLWKTKIKPVKGPVKLSLTIADTGAVDLANHEKCVVDFLVKHGLIEGDGRKVVRELNMKWGDTCGCVVEVLPI
jgi:Holliday junction resolvase RusA-like endonuclease